MSSAGQAISATKSTFKEIKVNFRLTQEEFKQLAELAHLSGASMSELIRQMIRDKHRGEFGLYFQCCKCKKQANFRGTVEAMASGWVKSPLGWLCPADVRESGGGKND